jgi:hypothetical protein
VKEYGFHSLLSYIHPPGGCIRLGIPTVYRDPGHPESTPFPFLVLSDSNPLTRLVGAQFETSSRSAIKKVFLLIQKDNYSLAKDSSTPISNSDIESFWQQAYVEYSSGAGDGPTIVLPEQLGDGGALVPFQSLCFCKVKEVFFHPPCPTCGSPLHMCTDDDLLIGTGLPGYSSSTTRFLFCASCVSSGSGTSFYVYDAGGFDNPRVKDRFELVKEFGQTALGGRENSGLPCVECSHGENCFGAGNGALSAIVPFSFYPFFLMIFDSMSFDGSNFLALVSGASPERLEARLRQSGEASRAMLLKDTLAASHMSEPFLFRHDELFFLEVLYLKLAFLGQLMAEALPGPPSSQAASLKFSIDGVWVKLIAGSGLLPYMWSFQSRAIDIIRSQFPKQSPVIRVTRLHQLGLLWFQALLVNDGQDVPEVNRAVEKGYDALIPDSTQSRGLSASIADPVFNPENNLWNSGSGTIREHWRGVWTESLDLGWALFRASYDGAADWSKADFLRQLQELRVKIKKELFSKGLSAAAAVEPLKDEEIHGILSHIRERWAAALGTAHKAKDRRSAAVRTPVPQYDAARQVGEEAAGETIASPAREGFEEATLPLDFAPGEQAEQLLRTVMVSPSKLSEEEPGPAANTEQCLADQDAEGESLPETVILSPSGSARSVRPSPPPEPETRPEEVEHPEDALPETVIISPSKEWTEERDSRRQAQTASDPDNVREAPHETGPVSPQAHSWRTVAADEEEEELSETLIVSPASSGGRPPEQPPAKRSARTREPVPEPEPASPSPDPSVEQTIITAEPGADDFEMETIILDPKKDVDKDKKRTDE